MKALKQLFLKTLSALPELKFPIDYFIPIYHTVSDKYLPHVKHIIDYKSIQAFEKDIDYLAKKFDFVDLETFSRTYQSVTSDKKPCLLTFDDGFIEFSDVIVPILERKGIYAINFINPAYTDNKGLMYRCKLSLIIEEIKQNPNKEQKLKNYLKINNDRKILISYLKKLYQKDAVLINSIGNILDINFEKYLFENKVYMDQHDLVRVTKKGFGIGAHSWDHPNYSMLNIDEQLETTKKSLDFLIETGIENLTFGFPFSDDGITKEFFEKIYNDYPAMQLSFGSAGIKKDSIVKNLQRQPMENKISAENIIKQQIAYYKIKTIFNKNTIIRH